MSFWRSVETSMKVGRKVKESLSKSQGKLVEKSRNLDYNGTSFCHFSNTFRAQCWILKTKEWVLGGHLGIPVGILMCCFFLISG